MHIHDVPTRGTVVARRLAEGRVSVPGEVFRGIGAESGKIAAPDPESALLPVSADRKRRTTGLQSDRGPRVGDLRTRSDQGICPVRNCKGPSLRHSAVFHIRENPRQPPGISPDVQECRHKTCGIPSAVLPFPHPSQGVFPSACVLMGTAPPSVFRI